MMKATASPNTLYLDMKSRNSFHRPFGGGGGCGGGLGSSKAFISLRTFRISSSSFGKKSPFFNSISWTEFNVYHNSHRVDLDFAFII